MSEGGEAKARRTRERAGRSPGAQRASASELGGRQLHSRTNEVRSEAARPRAIEGGRQRTATHNERRTEAVA